MHVAAVHIGNAPNIASAQEQRICDYSWKIDFGRLFEFAGGARATIGRAVLYGSRPPANDSLWNIAHSKGFEVVTHDRDQYTNREKKIDTNIVTDIITDSFE